MANSSVVKLHIRKRTLPEWLTLYIFVFPFLFGLVTDLLKLPGLVKYTVDVAWLIVFAILFLRKKIILKSNLVPFAIFTGIFFLYTFIVYVFNFQSPLYYLWGVRNNFRFYIAFIGFATFLDEYDVNSCFKLIDILFWINFVITLIQFFILGYEQDYLGGIFGVQKGCNFFQIIFLSIVIAKSLIWYINKKEKLWLCLIKSAFALIISAMAELKAFFFLFAIIVVLVMLVTSFSWRKLVLTLLGFALLPFAIILFFQIFPDWVEKFTLETLYEIISSDAGYTSSGDLNRLNAIPRIWTEIFDVWYQRLFGLGLGNCDTSTFAAFNTEFFIRYEYLHYSWFQDAFIFLETGLIGLIINIGFFGVVFSRTLNLKKKNSTASIYAQLAMVIAILSVFMLILNASLRSEAGYMFYFVLALPFINYKSGNLEQ